ncbi:TPA: hypothetical protein DCL30_03420 [Candidatus Peribacteria bacterium]|nr:hypothetical protein [Candidatus Peribacteria bacterium]HAS34272.1 hypothetical protein [Candidatus Peribacteria bacterium]
MHSVPLSTGDILKLQHRALAEGCDMEVLERLRWFQHLAEYGCVSTTCREFKIARSTLYRWIERFDPDDLSSLTDHPTTRLSRHRVLRIVAPTHPSLCDQTTLRYTQGTHEERVILRRPDVSILRDVASQSEAPPQHDTPGRLEGRSSEVPEVKTSQNNVFPLLRKHLRTLLLSVALALDASILFSILFPAYAFASSWKPTLLVNTEAFQIIDDSDAAANVYIKFGDTLAETLTFNRTATRFQFSDNLYVAGKLDVTGTMSGNRLNVSTNQAVGTGAVFVDVNGNSTGMLLDSEATTAPGIAIDMNTASSVAPHILFGYRGTFDVNLFRAAANVLKTDDSLYVASTLSGAFINASSTFEGAGLTDCDTAATSKLLWDATTKKFSCGTDQTGTNGVLIGDADTRYVNTAGDTMTGALTIKKTSGTATGNTLVVDTQGLVYDATNKRVGIGTTSPLTKLDIHLGDDGLDVDADGISAVPIVFENSGNVWNQFRKPNGSYGGFLFNEGTNSDGAQFRYSWTGTASTSGFEFRGNATELMRITSDGKVGIGTTAPDTTLEVVGTASGRLVHAQDRLTSSGSLSVDGTSYLNSNTIITGNQNTSGNISASGTLSVTGAASLQSTVRINGVTYTFPYGDGAASGRVLATNAAGQLSWANVNSLASGFLTQTLSDDRYVNTSGDTMTGALKVRANLSGSTLTVDQTADIFGNLAVSGTTILDGSVGIGVTGTPETKLEVAGTMSGKSLQVTGTGATPLIYANAGNGNVGIGTTEPASKLAIYSGDNKDTGPIINLGGSAVNQFESGRLRFTETTSMEATTGYKGAFIHYDGSVDKLNIGVHDVADQLTSSDVNAISILRSNSNVGIGTTSPETKLEVIGTASGRELHAQDLLTSSGGLSVTGAASLQSTMRINGVTYTFPYGDGAASGRVLATNAAGQLSWASVSNLVEGSLTQEIADNRYVNTSGDTMTGALTIKKTSGTATGNTLVVDTQGLVYDATSKAVGVGTTSPTSSTKLDVVGGALRTDNWLFVDRTSGNLNSYLGMVTRGAASPSNYGNPLGNGATEITTYGTAGLAIGTYDKTSMVFGTNNAERMRIMSGGSIGIGTTNPTTKLEVNGAMSGHSLRMRDSVASSGSLSVDGTSYLNSNTIITGNQNTSGNISASGTLSIAGATSLQSTVRINGVTYTFPYGDGTDSGKVLKTNGAGQLSWATDAGSVNGLNYDDGDKRYVNTAGDTMTGALKVRANLSGSSLTVDRTADIFGNLAVSGTTLLDGNMGIGVASSPETMLEVAGTMSGKSLQVTGTGATPILYTDQTTGRVGIGTTSPANNLDIEYAGSTTNTNAAVRIGAPNGLNSAYLFMVGNRQTDGENIAALRGLSNVSGTETEVADIEFGKDGTGTDNGHMIKFETHNGTSRSVKMVIRGSGSVGIGTTSPETKLEVIGTMSGNLVHAQDRLTSSGTLSVTGAASLQSTVRINGVTYTFPYGDGAASGRVLATNAAGQLSWASVSNLVEGSLTQEIADNRYVNTSGDTMTGALKVRANLSGSTLDIDGTADIFGNLGVSGTTILDGNVGIGVTGTPETKLEVAGTMSGKSLQVTGTGATPIIYTDVSNGRIGMGTTSPSNALHVVNNSGVPARFERTSTTTYAGGGNSDVVLYNPDTTTNNTVRLSFDTLDDASAEFRGADITSIITDHSAAGRAADLSFLTISGGAVNPTEKMRILSTGNIGIGTTAPDTKLEVIGTASGRELHAQDLLTSSGGLSVTGAASLQSTVRINGVTYTFPYGDGAASGRVLATNAAGQLSWANVNSLASGFLTQTLSDDRYVNTSGDTMTGALKVRANLSGSTLTVDQTADIFGNLAVSGTTILDGNVGIGVTGTPETKLEVAGTMSGKSLQVTGTGAIPLIYTDVSNGRVGIGITTPEANLHVYDASGAGMNAATVEHNTTATNVIGAPLRIVRTSTGNMEDGFGAMISYAIKDDANVSNTIGQAGFIRNGADNSGMFSITPSNEGNLQLSKFIVDKTGNVGIGTTSPDTLLEVIGTASGRLVHAQDRLTSSGTLSVTGAASLQSTVRINGVTYTFPYGDGAASGKVLKTNGAGQLTWATDTSGGGQSNTGALMLMFDNRYVNTSGDTMTGALKVRANLSGSTLTVDQTADIFGNLAVSGTTILTGSVGVGVTGTPETKLEVVGTMSGTSVVASGLTGGRVTYAATGGQLIDNANLTFDGTNLNIGTTLTAQAPLTVNGGGYFRKDQNAGTALYVVNSATLGNTTASAQVVTQSNDSSGFFGSFPSDSASAWTRDRTVLGANSNASGITLSAVGTNQNINFFAGSTTEKMRLNSTGLGIGTTTPDTQLEVVGTASGRLVHAQDRLTSSGTLSVTGAASLQSTVRINGVTYTFPYGDGAASGKVLKTNGAGQLTWATDTSGGGQSNTGALMLMFDNRYVNTSGDTMTGALKVRANLSGSTLTVDQTADIFGNLAVSGTTILDGNVGIGVTGTPETKLEVAGTMSGQLLYISGTGASPLFFAGNGGVGIGTTAPGSKLHVIDSVAGTSSVQNGVDMATTVTGTSSADLVGLGYQGLYVHPVANNATNYNGVATIPQLADAAVTVGTINGALAYTGYGYNAGAAVSNAAGLRVKSWGNTPPGTFTNQYGVYVENITGAANNYSIYSAGGKNYFADNVGIGTTTPGTKLEVAGTMSGRRLNVSTSETTNTGAIFLNMDGNGTGMLLDSEATTAPGLAIDMNAKTGVAPHILFGYLGTFDVNLFRSAANVLKTDDSLYVSSTLSGAFINASSTFEGAGLTDCDTAATSKLLWDATTKKFSCGTDQTGGTSGISQDNADNRYVNTAGDTMTGALTIKKASGTATGNTLVVDTQGLVYDATNKRVGIGTASPQDTLDIAGNLILSTANTPTIKVEDTTNTVRTWMESTDSIGLIGTVSNHQLRLYTNNTAKMTIDTDGDTGIGTTAPDTTLEVIGTASGRLMHAQDRLTTSGSLSVTGAASLQSTVRINGVTYTFPYGDGAASGRVLATNAAGQLSWANVNTLGTGFLTQTLSDARYVNVAGDTMTGALKVQANLSGSTLTVDQTADIFGNLAVSGTTILDGSVGIGVTGTPETKLEVAGTMSGQSLQVTGTGTTPLIFTRLVYGTVGIGTSTPDNLLTLNKPSGNVLIQFNSNGTNYDYIGTSSAVDNPIMGMAPGDLGFRTQEKKMSFSNNSGNSTQVMIDTAGNVGIAQTSPTVKLQVTGSGSFTGANARVGIGTTTADTSLEVIGTASGRLVHAQDRLTTSGSLSVTGAASLQSTIRINGVTYTFPYGDGAASGRVLATNAAGQLSWANASSLVTGSLTQTSADARYVNVAGDTMTGALKVRANLSGSTLTVDQTADIFGNLAVSGTTILDGNVGIGVTGTPETKLEVIGAISGASLSIAGSNVTIGTDGAAIFNEQGRDVDFRIEGDTDANLFSVDASTDRIGIGTADPAQKLTLNAGHMLLSNNYEIRFKDSGGIERTTLELDSSNNLNVGTSAGGNLIFNNGATYTERMRIDANGRVGIGTTTPGAKLSVSGSTLIGNNLAASQTADTQLEVIGTASGRLVHAQDRLTSSGALSIDGTSYLNSNTIITGNQNTTGNIAGSGTLSVEGASFFQGALTLKKLAGSGTGDILVVDTRGLVYDATAKAVGVGTASPNAKLEVWGDGSSNTTGIRQVYSENTGYYVDLYMTNAGKATLASTGPNADIVLMPPAGRGVGIGTTTPGAKLSVSGALVVGPKLSSTATAETTLETQGTMSGRRLNISTSQTMGTGAIFLNMDGNGTGMLLDSEATNAVGLAIDMNAHSNAAPHLLFGYQGTFDVNLFRDAANVLKTDDKFAYTEDTGDNLSYVCYNSAGRLANCTSLEKYKNDIQDLGLGLETAMKLRPVRFTWKSSGEPDLGFIAEETEKVDPLLVSYNKENELSGVKYPQMTALAIAAIQEQQGEIEALQAQVEAIKTAQPSNATDEEEYSSVDMGLQPGELMCLDTKHKDSVTRCLGLGGETFMGVVTKVNKNGSVRIRVSGKISVRVTGEGGTIDIGSSLTTASIDGAARRASAWDRPVIGTALEASSGAQGEVLMLLK